MNTYPTLLAIELAVLASFAFAAENTENVAPRKPGGRPNITQGTLLDGAIAPDFVLQDIEGKKAVKLSELKGKPVVLIFGSCTCPPFVSSMRQVDELYSTYKDRAHFVLIYIREAHPMDGWVMQGNQFQVKSPKTLEERREIARDFVKRLNVSIPILVDTPDDKVEGTYACWPNRMYIVDADGKIVDKGMAGPRGTSISAQRAPEVLDRLLQGKK